MANPSIDERIEALTHSLELFKAEQEQYQAQLKRLDARERAARRGLLLGIQAYLEALNGDEDEDEE